MQLPTMHLNACFLCLFLCVALIEAGPAPKTIEKKSLAEDVKAESKKADLKIEEAGEDKDRSKKSTFCVQIGSEASQPAQVSWKENQMGVQNIPMALHTQSQPIQTLNLQPVAQTLPQASVMMPQQMVQPPIHTLQIVQSPPQPCAPAPAPAVNIIQSVPQTKVIKTIQKPKPKPKPTGEEQKPMRIEQIPQPLPEPQETLTVLPVAPTCHEHLMLVSEPEQPQMATYVQVPSMIPCTNPMHGYLNPCSCQQNLAMFSESGIEPMAMKMLPIAYSSTYARPPLIMPYDTNAFSHVVVNDNVDVKVGPQARTHNHIKVKYPHHIHVRPELSQQTIYQNMYVQGSEGGIPSSYASRDLVDNAYATKEVTINAFPQTFRDANSMHQAGYQFVEDSLGNQDNASNNPTFSEVDDLMQSNKTPRQIESNQLLPENTVETKQDDGRAMLIDGRRNARSNKEKTKEIEKKSKTN